MGAGSAASTDGIARARRQLNSPQLVIHSMPPGPRRWDTGNWHGYHQTRLLRSLEVSRTVTEEELKKSYRKLAVKYHPGQKPGRPQGRGEIQGTRRGVRHPQRSRQARRLRPLRPRGVFPGPAARVAWRAGGSIRSTCSARCSAGAGRWRRGGRRAFSSNSSAGGGRRPDREGRQRGSDLRYDLQIKPRGGRRRGREGDRDHAS